MSNERIRTISKGIGVAAIIAACGALALGGYTVVHGAGQGAEASSVSVIGSPTPAPVQDTTSALAFHESEVSQMRADDLAAQVAAKAAADKAAVDAAAKLAASVPVKKVAAITTSSATGNPKGTPLPFTKSTDPQNANGGDYADPATFCSSRSASTVGGVPQCD